jgi:hypothetical protein
MTDTTGARAIVIGWMAVRDAETWLDSGTYATIGRSDMHRLIALIDSYAAELEAVARADEREKCAERAVKWFNDPVNPCYAQEYDDDYWDQELRAAIIAKEGGK